MTTEQMDAVDAMRSAPPEKESTAVAVATPPSQQQTDLVLREDQGFWDDKQLAALDSIGVAEAPNAQLALFFHQAKRTGLDPFAKQIYLIKRRQKVDGSWVDKWGIQTAIDGFRVIRDRIGGFAGMREQWCGPDGVWRDVWLSSEPPAAARVLVWKHGDVEPTAGIALWSEYAPMRDGKPQAMWGRMPALMLAKCAEALAYRKRFPQDFEGLYTAEEMAQSEEGVTTLRTSGGTPAQHPEPGSAPGAPPQAPVATPPAPAGAASESAQPSSGSAPTGSGSSSAPAGRGEPPADVVANWRRHVLSREYKGSQTSRDGGMRTAFQEVRKAGLLDYAFEPGGPTFRQKMVELSASLPEGPNEAGDVSTTQAGEPRPGWTTGADGWAVPPEDQPL